MSTITKTEFSVFLKKFDLSPRLDRLAWHLGGFEMDPTKHATFPGVVDVAKKLKVSVRTIQRYLKKLTDMDVLTRKSRYRKNGSQTSNLFCFNFAETTKQIAKKYYGSPYLNVPCHPPCHPSKPSFRPTREAVPISQPKNPIAFRSQSAKAVQIPRFKALPIIDGSTSSINFNSITKLIDESEAHESVKNLTLEKAYLAFESGTDRKGRKIFDLKAYVSGILRNYIKNPYQKQRAHFAASGAFDKYIDLTNSRPQSIFIEAIDIPF